MADEVDSDDIRIGTTERESSVRLLGDHFTAGRLQVEEYEERVGRALASTTRGDLRPLFADLPAPYPTFMAPPLPPLPTAPPPSAVHSAPPAPMVNSDRSRLVAGALQILLPFGIGRFYTGHTGIALAQLFTAFIFVGVIWSFVDGLILIAMGGSDQHGRPLRY